MNLLQGNNDLSLSLLFADTKLCGSIGYEGSVDLEEIYSSVF